MLPRLHALTRRKAPGTLTVENNEFEMQRSRSFWERFKAGFIEAHRRRPPSFYLLLLIPLVLVLGAHIFQAPISPRRFTLMLSLMLVLLWLISAWAVSDFFSLWRKHRAEQRSAYLETIGDPDFAERLGSRVRNRPDKS